MTEPKAKLMEELNKFETSAEKFEYLSGLSELSWDDCQDAWFMAKQLIPEVAKEMRAAKAALELAAEREKKLVAALSFYAGPTRWRKDVKKYGYHEDIAWEASFITRYDHGEIAQATLKELGLAEGGESGEG